MASCAESFLYTVFALLFYQRSIFWLLFGIMASCSSHKGYWIRDFSSSAMIMIMQLRLMLLLLCLPDAGIMVYLQSDLHWQKPISVEVEESLLIEASRLRFNFFQSRKLWSDRFVGYAIVNLHVRLVLCA